MRDLTSLRFDLADKKILSTTISTLEKVNCKEGIKKVREQYRNNLKYHVICFLKDIIEAIEQEDFYSLEKVICHSSGGDVGEENDYIHFGCVGLEDIGEILEALKR